MRHEYKIEIERDGRWWMVQIPELDGLTQARRLSEATLMGREWIAVRTGTPLADVAVQVTRITVPGLGDIQPTADDLAHMRKQAAQAAEKAQDLAVGFARQLTTAGVPVRDAAGLLDVSPQRISQLANFERQIHEDNEAPKRP
jgi:hypothetical protein